MDSALLLLKTVGFSPGDRDKASRWMLCDAFSSSRSYEDRPIAFKCSSHGVPLTKIPEQNVSFDTKMSVSFTTSKLISSHISHQSFVELYLTDDGPKIRARIFVENEDFDFILNQVYRHNGKFFIDFTVNVESEFSYSDGNVWSFPEFPPALNPRVARRSGGFEIEHWSSSFPYGEMG
jgi:hypothetical protein